MRQWRRSHTKLPKMAWGLKIEEIFKPFGLTHPQVTEQQSRPPPWAIPCLVLWIDIILALCVIICLPDNCATVLTKGDPVQDSVKQLPSDCVADAINSHTIQGQFPFWVAWDNTEMSGTKSQFFLCTSLYEITPPCWQSTDEAPHEGKYSLNCQILLNTGIQTWLWQAELRKTGCR